MNSSSAIIHNTHVQTENTPLLPQVNQERSLSQRVYDTIFCLNSSEYMSEEQVLNSKLKQWEHIEGNFSFSINRQKVLNAYREDRDGLSMFGKTLPDVFDIEKFKTNITSFSVIGLREFPPSFGNLHNLKNLEITGEELPHILGRICLLTLGIPAFLIAITREIVGHIFFCPCITYQRGINAPFNETSLGIRREINELLWSTKDLCNTCYFDFDVLRNFTQLEVLHLYKIPLTTIPEEIKLLPSLKDFIFRSQEPFFIPDWIEELTLLEKLELKNGLNPAPSSIGNLNNLQSLVISHNPLSFLPESFKNLTSLETLTLHSTLIEEIPGWINCLTLLESLELQGSKVSSLPQSLLELPTLTSLTLVDCKITDLPEWFGQLKLIELNLAGNFLKFLPEPLKNITTLRQLCLNKNSIVSLPDWIGSFTELTLLELKENTIETLPLSIGNLSQLKTLDLSHNKISYLPDSLGNLISVKNLNISYNRIVEIPPSFGNMSSLKNVLLNNNPHLRSLPLTIGNCTLLTFIDVSKTQVPRVEVNAINSRSRRLRSENNAQTYPIRLQSWLNYAKSDTNLNFLIDERHFSLEQQSSINEWLLRLEVTKDFNNARSPLAVLVCAILDSLKPSTVLEAIEFKNAFFGHLDGNLVHCGDRASMLINLIYTDWQLLMVNKNASDTKKMHLLIGIAKTLTLREVLQEHLVTIQSGRTHEFVETYLYYETKLKKILGLETAVSSMYYSDLGRIDTIDENALIHTVNTKYIDTLCYMTAIDSILEKNTEYLRRKKDIIFKTADEMALLEDREWSQEDAYMLALNKIKEKRENELALLKKHSLLQILKK